MFNNSFLQKARAIYAAGAGHSGPPWPAGQRKAKPQGGNPRVDKRATLAYNKLNKGAVRQRLAPVRLRSNRIRWQWGGYFFLFNNSCMNRLQMPIITRRSVNTSIVLIGQAPFPFRSGAKKLPPWREQTAAVLDSAIDRVTQISTNGKGDFTTD